jgi:hypothetical protein
MNNKENVMMTTDIWMVTFLRLRHNIAPVNWDKNQRGKTVFHFNVQLERWKELKKQFVNDDIVAIKYQLEKIKDLVY